MSLLTLIDMVRLILILLMVLACVLGFLEVGILIQQGQTNSHRRKNWWFFIAGFLGALLYLIR